MRFSGQNLLLAGGASGLQMIDMDSGVLFRKFQTRGTRCSGRIIENKQIHHSHNIYY